MTDVSIAEARKNLADLLNRVVYSRERVVLTRHGREVAAIVSIEELGLVDRLKTLLREKEVLEAIEELASGDTVDWAELKGALRP